MKVSFENGVSTYSGKYLEVVYQSWFSNRLCYARKNFYPTLGNNHQTMSTIASNLNLVYLAADPLYRSDLKAYAQLNQRQNVPKHKHQLHKMPSAKSLFIECMWDWYASDPEHVDLKTVTVADIVAMEAPVRTVKECVEAHYLKRVSNYEALNHLIARD